MRILPVLFISMMLASLGAQQEQQRPEALSCNRSAISAEERPRHRELSERLVAAVMEQSELKNGYALRVDGGGMRLAEAAEWMERERKCCPFLVFELETNGRERDFWVRLTGPEGTKALLDQVFSQVR